MYTSLKNRETTRYLVLDHTLTSPLVHIDSSLMDFRDKQAGYFGIRYHYVITRLGHIETGRPFEKQSPVTKVANPHSVLVMMVGGKDENKQVVDNFTVHQKITLRSLYRDLKAEHPDLELCTLDNFLNRGKSAVAMNVSKFLSEFHEDCPLP